MAVPSSDGEWVFASLSGSASVESGLAVLHRKGGEWIVNRVLRLKTPAVNGLALTHDGRVLIAAAWQSAVAIDVQALTDGGPEPTLGSWAAKGTGAVNVVITADDAYAFVSNERTASLSVLDLTELRKGGRSKPKMVGNIPVGEAPVGLAFSPDGKWLYSASQVAPADYGWPIQFPPEGEPNSKPNRPAGVLAVIDVKHAETDPANSVVRRVAAGNSPVRVVVAPDGEHAYLTLRGANAVGLFSTGNDTPNTEPAIGEQVKVGAAPVGIALSNDGHFLFVANSNRFGGADKPETLSVLDTTRLQAGPIDSIPAGRFPREIRLTTDGKTLIIANYDSDTVEFVDVSSLIKASSGI